jgi:hypothetical protein
LPTAEREEDERQRQTAVSGLLLRGHAKSEGGSVTQVSQAPTEAEMRELQDAVIASDPFQIMPLTRKLLAEREAELEDLEAVGIFGCYCEPRSEQ